MRLPLLLPLLALALPAAVESALLAIDYGAEFTKLALVKPGVPIDIVLNKDSKRKVQSVVGWKKDERLFGSEAAAVSGRYPYDSFPYLKPLLGVPASGTNHPDILFPSLLHPSNRSTVAFTLGSAPSTHYTVEELVGMQFAYGRELAEHMAGEKISEAVIVIPGWWGQAERQAVKDAAEIGGLRTVDLINDATAIAMNFAMTRAFPTKEHHLFYDSGALSTSATLVSFHTFPAVPSSPLIGKSSKYTPAKVNTTHVEVLGLGFDDALGGQRLDALIKRMLVNEFEAKLGKPMEEGGDETFKALGKMGKEAARVKAILSANADAAVGIESLYNDIDFRTRISREQLEEAAAPLIIDDRFARPIADALSMANLTVADVDSLILFGGNSRVPMVRSAVRNFIGEAKMAQNVNSDEGAVLGAAFYGATQSRQFKTKEYRVKDISLNGVEVAYQAGEDDGEERTVTTAVFGSGAKTGRRKTLKVNGRSDDFDLAVRYASGVKQGEPLFDVKLTGLAAAIEAVSDNATTATPLALPQVRVVTALDESGLFHVVEASVLFVAPNITAGADEEKGGLGGKLKGFFGGKDAAASSDGKKDANETETAATVVKDEVKKDIIKKLGLEYSYSGAVAPLTREQKWTSRAKLQAIDALELSRREREEALNHLEGYLYRLRDLLEPGQEGSLFWQYSQPAEREKLQEGVIDGMAWLEEDGWRAETAALRKRADDLSVYEKPAQFRNTEARTRAGAVEKFQQALFAGRAFIQSAKANATEDATAGRTPKYTSEEIDNVHLHMVGLEEWFGAKADVQKDLATDQDPVVTTAELDAKGKTFQDKVLKLIKRKAPVQPKLVKIDEPVANATTATEGDESAPDADEPIVFEEKGEAAADESEEAKPEAIPRPSHAQGEL